MGHTPILSLAFAAGILALSGSHTPAHACTGTGTYEVVEIRGNVAGLEVGQVVSKKGSRWVCFSGERYKAKDVITVPVNAGVESRDCGMQSAAASQDQGTGAVTRGNRDC